MIVAFMPDSTPWLGLLRDPDGLGSLQCDGNTLVNPASRRRYRICDSIPVLLDEADLGPQNLKIKKMYQWMAKGFDLADGIGNFLTGGSLTKFRRQLASRLGLRPGNRLLYTSIGTGLDLPFLAEQVPLDSMEVVGLDLSMEMLRKCQSRMRRHTRTGLLLQANAERLPLAGNAFDIVLHVGGINQFDRPAAAVTEMIRVARPGARILIADETNRSIKSQYQGWNPFTRSTYKDMPAEFDPRSWVPAGVNDVVYQEVAKGRMYFLAFTAPP